MERANLSALGAVEKVGALPTSLPATAAATAAPSAAVQGLGARLPRQMTATPALRARGQDPFVPQPGSVTDCWRVQQTCRARRKPGGLHDGVSPVRDPEIFDGRVADAFYLAFASGIAWIVLTAIAIAAIFFFYNPAMDARRLTSFVHHAREDPRRRNRDRRVHRGGVREYLDDVSLDARARSTVRHSP